MASFISIIIACVLWVIALFLPVMGDDSNGFMLILFALFMHIFILPIVMAFPVWANFTFFRAIWFYVQFNGLENKHLKRKNELQEKAKEWATITFLLMFFGMLIYLMLSKEKIQLGAIVWFLSGIFLLFGIYIQQVSEKYAVLSLSALVISICSLGVLLYQYESKSAQYQDGLFQTFNLKWSMFQGRESDLPIPPLVRVKLNDLAWAEKGIKPEPQEVDLSFSKSDQIELQFQSVIPQIIDRKKKPVCELKQGQQFELPRPAQYIEHDIVWKNYRDFAIGTANKAQSDYIYRLNYVDHRHAQVEIIRKKDHKNVYIQNLVTYEHYDRCSYGPVGYRGELDALFKSAYSAKELNGVSFKIEGKFAGKEKLNTACTWESRPERVYAFEGKFLKILDLSIVKPQILCSEHYIAVVNLSKDDNGEHLDDSLEVQFLHRDTFQPIDCGWLLFHLEKMDIQKLFSEEIRIKSLDILDIKNSNICPDIQIELSNSLKDVQHNYLADYY